MEENVDPINENFNKKEESLTDDFLKDKGLNQPNVMNIQSKNNLDQNNKITSQEVTQEIKNEELVPLSTNDKSIKPKKDIPIEKKPFNEFINDHLLPSIINEFRERGFEVKDINLKNTLRPIAGDKCWVIYCEIKDICNFWLSFEKEDISSLKSISLCKSNQQPSVIESFLIDEKRITLKLIISRILQRLNGQKLIGVN